jgi:hypothetical protein
MKTRFWQTVFVGLSLALLMARPSRSDETVERTPADEQLRKIKELLDKAVDWYDVLPAADAEARLRPDVVLRWQNPVRTQTGASLMVLWTDHGRPAAMASIFQWDNDICHEFGSLSRSSSLVARNKTTVIWSPAKAGVEFQEVPGGANHEILRLLARPLYRYDLKESKAADPHLLEGGMFAFVMGTDPEVILLLEAIQHGEDVTWEYAFVRATGWAAEASLGDRVVWSVGAATQAANPKDPLFQIRRPLP